MNSPATLAQFHKQLHHWYAQHGRKDLPWRNTKDAYAIYVSEIMLQQTQVKTVLARYYQPFLKKFPTLKKLAAASEREVLSEWQGLGYYNRALNLHKAAKQCVGVLPDTVESLIALPGIGRNTAHAIAAFAYRRPVPVMEANVKRIIARVFALERTTDNELWDKAEWLLDKKQPFDYNQAMMDIGALVCTVRAPACSSCPAATLCKGKHTPHLFPAAKQRKAVPVRHKHIIIRRNPGGEYFARPRTTQFLRGLYHFDEYDTPPRINGTLVKVGHVTQKYSHFTLDAEVHLLQTKDSSGKGWYSLTQLKHLPVSNAEKKILEMLP